MCARPPLLNPVSCVPTGPAAKEETPLTVEDVISTPASLYVRHTLPLGQARTAMLKRRCVPTLGVGLAGPRLALQGHSPLASGFILLPARVDSP